MRIDDLVFFQAAKGRQELLFCSCGLSSLHRRMLRLIDGTKTTARVKEAFPLPIPVSQRDAILMFLIKDGFVNLSEDGLSGRTLMRACERLQERSTNASVQT